MIDSHGMSTVQLSCPGGRTDRWIASSSHVTTNQSIVTAASSHPRGHPLPVLVAIGVREPHTDRYQFEVVAGSEAAGGLDLQVGVGQEGGELAGRRVDDGGTEATQAGRGAAA